MRQVAADPEPLVDLVAALRFRAGWTFDLSDLDRGQGSRGLTLSINITVPDAYHPERARSVVHYFPVPPAAYDSRSWRRWLFDRIGDVDTHERCECFEIDGVRPFAPSHGPGSDPYLVRELGTDEDVRTSFRGEVKPKAPVEF